jgi:FtsP/CotA-like multicopper oxidase with cupredoxin domain
MNTKILDPRLAAYACTAMLSMACGSSLAAEFWLRAEATTATMPGGVTVPMWGFASCTDATYATCQPASVPGPALSVPPNDPQGLIVNVLNTLPAPISLVIPGQIAAMTPVWSDGSSGPRPDPAARVRSFTHEAAPLTGTATYTWPVMKAGTYLYHSGTHPQVQVQMGLYGAATQDSAAGFAYPGVAYDQAVTLLYSEIDPALHNAVGGPSPTYGTATGPTSTFDYVPKYFLVNGKPFSVGDPAIATITTGKTTLLRFINAGLKTHVPVVNGPYMKLIAEDGNAYPWGGNPRQRYSVFLPAGKTTDTTLNAPFGSPARIAIYDRALALTNDKAQDGGMLAFLDVADLAPPPVANAPTITSTAGTSATYAQPYTYTVVGNDVDGDTLVYSLDQRPVGMTINASTGVIKWTPSKAQAQAGSAPVTARVTDPGALFATQAYTIAVTDVNAVPVAVNDAYSMVQGSTLTVAARGVLVNDSDLDTGASSLQAILGTPPVGNGLTLNADGGFVYTPLATLTGTRTFTYQARDPSLAVSNAATVTITISANRAPVAKDDTFTVTRNTTGNVLDVALNDTDPDTVLDPNNKVNKTTVTISSAPNRGGTATKNAAGNIVYTPARNFRGTENFSYRVSDTRGLQSGVATVRVNVN